MMSGKTYDIDLIVIGGGSAGLAGAKAAAALGAEVTLFDFVMPTSHGTKWGLGGTCVNVGCIPKKLMHKSARVGLTLKHDSKAYGWHMENVSFNWDDLRNTVQRYVKQLNFGYRNALKSSKVTYVNAFAKLVDAHTVIYTHSDKEHTLSAKYILVACGGRPFVSSEVPGAKEFAITSDDLFSLKEAPGKTLVVGGSYIALECAGFLTELGYDTTVCARSILLRGFDRQCAEKLGECMSELGCKFLYEINVNMIKKSESSSGHKFDVTFTDGSVHGYDTVLYATGRRAAAKRLGLEEVGVMLNEAGKIVCDDFDRTDIPSIYAVGDTVHGRPELVPTAVKAAELLAQRLFASGGNTLPAMDYLNVPTTVFTPMEYGCVGLSEEDAESIYGKENIEVFLFEFNPVEISAAHWEKSEWLRANPDDKDVTPMHLSKLVCLKSKQMKVVGFHCIGLDAGETTQGYALAIKCGLTKAHFDATLGIHPTSAESFHAMDITRRSGQPFKAAGGCGGGKCG